MFAGEDSAVPGASGSDPRSAAGCGQVHGGGAYLPRLPHRVHGGLAGAAAGQDRQELLQRRLPRHRRYRHREPRVRPQRILRRRGLRLEPAV